MASDRVVASVLAMLHELYPTREITPTTLDAFAVAFADVSDDEFRQLAVRAAREPGRSFFPTPGDILGQRPSPVFDIDRILARVSGLGHHNPNRGWIYPTPEVVRRELGDAIADAYVGAGTTQCFAPESGDGSAVGRDIARRQFAKDLIIAAKRSPIHPSMIAGKKPEVAMIPDHTP